jgi:hypothetical protein
VSGCERSKESSVSCRRERTTWLFEQLPRRILRHEVSKCVSVEEVLPFELISVQDHNFLAALCVHGRPCQSRPLGSQSSGIQSHPVDMGVESSL